MARKYDMNFEDRKIIEKMIKKKFSSTEIGKAIGRDKTTVNREIKRVGGRELYKAEIAQKVFENNRKANYLEMRKKSIDECLKDTDLYQRMENIEFQMEILTDIIKQLRGSND